MPESQYQKSSYDTYAWVCTSIIEDEDLTFGGKALSTWYEEDRSRLSTASNSAPSSSSGGSTCGEDESWSVPTFGDEERRGRERTRRSYHTFSRRK